MLRAHIYVKHFRSLTSKAIALYHFGHYTTKFEVMRHLFMPSLIFAIWLPTLLAQGKL